MNVKSRRSVVKQQGGANDLLERLAADPAFVGINLNAALDPGEFVGRAPQQVDEFLAEVVAPIRQRYAQAKTASAEVRV